MNRRKLLEHEWPRDPVLVSTLDIGCSDRRIKGSRGLIGETTGCDESIPITRPGGIKNLVAPKDPRDRECFLEEIELVIEGVKTIRCRMHCGCKGCGYSQDLDFYEGILLEAGAILRARFPGVEVTLFIIDFEAIYVIEKDEVFAEVLAV